MLLLGHMGIGSAISWRWTRDLPKSWVLFGTVLPDIIDKPLYYSLSFLYHKRGADLGYICGTRTFGHSGILLVLLLLAIVFKGSRAIMAITIGMITHLVLDAIGDHFELLDESATIHSFLMPLLSPVPQPHPGMLAHVQSYIGWNYSIAMELLGGILLIILYHRQVLAFLKKKTLHT